MLLEISKLSISFPTPAGYREAVQSVSFELAEGETLGVVGESGCGKSIVNLALMGLLPKQAMFTANAMRFAGKDLLQYREKHWQKFRGASVAMIFQDPMSALNPCLTVGDQLLGALKRHRPEEDRKARFQKALQLLELVGIAAASRRMDTYPHQLSGGMAQRVMIAMALACEPRMLIADEPTTALDVTLQDQILRLLADLQKERRMAMILVTHDLALASHYCDRIQVMYAGAIVEAGRTEDLIEYPAHPYTQGLLNALPSRHKGGVGSRLVSIPGVVPPLQARVPGCPFRDRCALAHESCLEMPPAISLPGGRDHRVSCFFHTETRNERAPSAFGS